MNGIKTEAGGQKRGISNDQDQSCNAKNMIPAASIEINVVEFLESRSRELESMRENALLVSTNARVMQQLPRHMRRRAASHNVKRLPRELRLAAEKEMQKSGGTVSTSKRPSRRHRRRPRNLLQEYERRKRKHVWLETHVWHAKRFHMAELWGYKIPLHPNERGIRAAYRDSINKCLVFDLSYYCCVELTGSRETLLSGLARLSSPAIAPSFASQKYARGTKEGQTVLYRDRAYPFHALGDVRFLWKPQLESDGKETSRSLWVWIHPASYQLILDEFKKVFQTTVVSSADNVDNNVAIRSLKDELCRFRLVGPASQQVLRRVFLPASLPKTVDGDDQGVSCWWQGQGDGAETEAFERQASNWDQMETFQSTTDLIPNSVYGLVARDPRVLSSKKEAVKDLRCAKQQAGPLESWTSLSPIWSHDVRQSVKVNMKTTHEVNELKSKNLVPGLPLDLGLRESRIPTLFIQNPGTSSTVSSKNSGDSQLGTLGYGSGWDVILPSGWSLPYWNALNHCEGHPGGLQELQHTSFEQLELSFPDNYPDTPAGAELNISGYLKANEKYNRIPPGKRINYGKLRVAAPFHFPWKELVEGWCKADQTDDVKMSPDEEFYCLRDRNMLRLLQTKLNKNLGQLNKSHSKQGIETTAACDIDMSLQKIRNHPCLVPVHLVMCDRGMAGKFSMICEPKTDDLIDYFKSPHKPGLVNEESVKIRKTTSKKQTCEETASKKRKCEESADAEQPVKRSKLDVSMESESDVDMNPEEGKNVADEHLGEATSETVSSQSKSIPPTSSKECTDDQKCLPTVGIVVNYCSRRNLGYVVSPDSGLTYSKGCGSAIGFVALSGLLSLIENQTKLFCDMKTTDQRLKIKGGNKTSGGVVLVRSTSSEHYRFARLNVLLRD